MILALPELYCSAADLLPGRTLSSLLGSYLVCNQVGSRYCLLKCIFDEVMKRECESVFLLLSSE